MGCQTSSPSKLVQSPEPAAKAQTQSKTLLDASEASKASGDVKSSNPEAPSVALPPTAHSEDQTAQKSISSAVQETPRKEDQEEETRSPHPMEINNASIESSTVPVSSLPPHGSGWLRKQRTLCTDSTELDVMVVEFSSHDSTVGSMIGRNCKEMKWKVMCDLHADPIDIKVNVQEHKLHYNEVSIESDGRHLLHGAGSHVKTKMTEDFRFQWPFRAMIRGVNEAGFFEFRPAHMPADVWYPAVIIGQHSDGYFEVRAKEIDGMGRILETTYPAVRKEDLREAVSRKPLTVPEDCLTLDVPKQDPLHATLRLANGELITHRFGRPSPARGMPEAKLKVSKDRKLVTANVGHSVLSHFVSGEVQAAHHEAERLRHSWTIQAGPFAEHTIEITKRYTLGKIVTLLVDGEVLVEASAADIGCQSNEWCCDFRFVGERILDFEVHKTNIDGAALDETARIKERRKYVHTCTIVIPNGLDFHSASLSVDGINFQQLPLKPQHHSESNLSMEPTAMLHSYGINTPYKVDLNAPSNMLVLAKTMMCKADEGRQVMGSLFAQCCTSGSVAKDNEIHA